MGAQDDQEDSKKEKGSKGETEETAIDMTKEEKADKAELEEDSIMMVDGVEDRKRKTSDEENISDCSDKKSNSESREEKEDELIL
eukprot:12651437-Ditylum_brightwellii.AAC.1